MLFALPAMATRFELVLHGGGERELRSAGEAALEEIELVDRRWSRFRRNSWLAHLEREALARPVSLDADDCELLRAALEVHELSGGAFDVCIGARTAGRAKPGSWGTSRDIELDRSNRSVRFHRPLALDFGAIAKGHALDLARRSLLEAGVEHAFLHGGTSSVCALGRAHGGAPWCVRVGSRAIEFGERALGVSAQHGRRSADGRGHVLDPRSGQSADGEQLAAVLAPSARAADAWSTAALVLGALPAGLSQITAFFEHAQETAA